MRLLSTCSRAPWPINRWHWKDINPNVPATNHMMPLMAWNCATHTSYGDFERQEGALLGKGMNTGHLVKKIPAFEQVCFFSAGTNTAAVDISFPSFTPKQSPGLQQWMLNTCRPQADVWTCSVSSLLVERENYDGLPCQHLEIISHNLHSWLPACTLCYRAGELVPCFGKVRDREYSLTPLGVTLQHSCCRASHTWQEQPPLQDHITQEEGKCSQARPEQGDSKLRQPLQDKANPSRAQKSRREGALKPEGKEGSSAQDY